jgi:hypothetical protein
VTRWRSGPVRLTPEAGLAAIGGVGLFPFLPDAAEPHFVSAPRVPKEGNVAARVSAVCWIGYTNQSAIERTIDCNDRALEPPPTWSKTK